ncbi:MAG: molybdopterin dehydrogenase FAD-binding [Ferruginibacter sp.]|nr:molybdopterin dehydrogenase FAD-binding [Ferruginibacter sp.]
MNPFDYKRVTTLKDAISAVKPAASVFLAGGTNLIDLMKRGVTAPETLVDINNLPYNKIEKTATGIRIGAMVHNSDASEHPLVTENFPLLSLALKSGASPQLRNMATTGGNMNQRTRCGYFYDTTMPCNKRSPGSGCSAIGGYTRMHAIFGTSEQCIAVHPSDMCVGLAALDATVTISNGKSEKKILFTDYHRLPGTDPSKDNILQKGELITAVDIPFNKLAKNAYYLKIRDRASYAFALVSVAAALDIQNGLIQSARLAMGGVAHKPWRLFEAENMLQGKRPTNDNFLSAANLAMTGAKSFGANQFKLKLAPNAILEALHLAAGKSAS